MNEYGALVEWYLQGKIVVVGENLSLGHIVHHKSHMDWPQIKPGPQQWQAGD
jgi:hypothetical protein